MGKDPSSHQAPSPVSCPTPDLAPLWGPVWPVTQDLFAMGDPTRGIMPPDNIAPRITSGTQTPPPHVPVSVCSDSCPPGTRKALQKGKPICCYDCIPCPEGEISNATVICVSVCSMDTRELRFSRAMVFAIEEINNSTELLPGIKLGYLIHDSCASVPVAVHVAFQLSNGLDPVFYTGDNCSQSGMVMGIVAESGSTPSISMSRIVGSFNIPQVSHFATCACLSDKQQYPSFFRTIPKSTAVVVVAFLASGDMRILLEELSREPSPPRQWIGSEAWVTDPEMLRFSFCAGAVGFGIQRSVIPGLRDFLLDLSPTKVAASPVLTEFWEGAFNCKLGKSAATDQNVCDGTEDIKTLQSPYTDTSQLRITNMVYKAVYAIAHAIHNAVCQKTNSTIHCDKFSKIEAEQVLTELKKVNFSQNGYDVSFDANGDPVARYELVNWQKSTRGNIELVTVGQYDASLPVGHEFRINKNLTWAEDGTEVPVSVCSDSCPPGTRKALQKGKPICCYDCIPCPEGEISNATDSPDCLPCPKEFWPNAERDTCAPKPVEFLSYTEVLGIILAVFSVGAWTPVNCAFHAQWSSPLRRLTTARSCCQGIKLGYLIHDSCASVPVAVHVAFQLSNGLDPVFYTGDNCSQSGMVMGIVGESGSTPSISMSRIVGSFNIPQFQAEALAKLVKHFGWTWIGAVRSDSDYGNNGMASFLDAAHREGICVEYSVSFYRTHPRSKIQRVADVIRRSTAVVVVAFLASGDMRILLEELSREPSPPRQWIGSEAWVTDPEMLRFSFCAGAVGFGIQRSVIPGLRDFLLDLSPTKVAASPVLTEFWEGAFNCKLGKSAATDQNVCDGTEDIKTLQSPYTDTSQLRITNMVYKAVYAIAHAIHNAVCQKTNSTIHCDKFSKIEAEQVLTELKKVNFSQNGYDVSFDANGDPVARYELVNWQKSTRGNIELVTVGQYDASLPVGHEFRINKNLTWAEDGTEVPVSVCSDSCPPGTRKALQKGKPICCYDCIPCPEGEISNATDSPDCLPCPKEFWPNAERDTCAPKPVEFLSYTEVLGIILAAFSQLVTGQTKSSSQAHHGEKKQHGPFYISGRLELLTSTGDIDGRWKKYFKDLLNPTDLPSNEEAEAGDSSHHLSRSH
ncbi:hypothetical protein L3Q82_004941 [Scortum barcoo]|uniref:Uncharacterized protein n=1 Tax=Scortum barcoo TaxID=214431 RepID=A0ACB8VDV0_9TELE|nr:hypothetical protein L3Q82_004941 [Scortum barcoo]